MNINMSNIGSIIEIITNILTCISIIVAAIFYVPDRVRANRVGTLEAYDRLQREVLDEINMWSVSEICEAMEDRQSDAYKKLSAMLARIEHFCAGINVRAKNLRRIISLISIKFGIKWRRKPSK